MKSLTVGRDKHSTPTYDIPISDLKIGTHMTGGILYTFNVPPGAQVAIFASDNHFALSTATFTLLPIGTAPAEVDYEWDPQAREVTAGESLWLRSNVNCQLTISYYSRARED